MQELSDKMHAAGIPGIKYLDQNSRGKPAEEQTYNYVVFDPKDIEITHRNGERVRPPIEQARALGVIGPEPKSICESIEKPSVTQAP